MTELVAAAPKHGASDPTGVRRWLPGALVIVLLAAVVAGILAGAPPRTMTFGVLVAFGVIWGITLYVWQDYRLRYVMLAPAIFLLLTLSVFPFLYALRASFHDVSAINLMRDWRFIGLRNYELLLTDRLTWQSLLVTVEYIALALAIEFTLGFFLALLLDRVSGLLMALFLMPMMVTPLVAGLIWKYMFNIDNGFFNVILIQMGLPPVPWLTYDALPGFALLGEAARDLNFTYAMFSTLVIDIWQWTPMMALLVYAGMRSLPEEPFEAARVDGASTLQMWRYVLFPLLRPVIAVAILIRFIDVVKVYDPVWALFGNGFRTLNIYLGTFFFRMRDYGGGAALSILILLLVSIIAPVLLRTLYRET